MENNNENKELHSKKFFKGNKNIIINTTNIKLKFQSKPALGSLAKNDIYYSSTQNIDLPLAENSDLNTNYEKSNTSKNKNFTNFQKNQIKKNSKSLDLNKPYAFQDQNLSENILHVKAIILNLRRSLEANNKIQNALMQKYERLSEKQILIEKTLEKIKRINKSKQKKHIKYLKYTPLNKVYYYCPKKIHYYYILMDLVIKSRKKNKQMLNNNFHFSLGGNNSNVSKKKDINRFKFSKKEDAILKKNLLFSVEAENIDWAAVAREAQTKNAFQLFVRSLEISNFYAYKKWTSIEDNILRKAILYYGPKNWQQISYCLDGRNNSQCFHRWMKGINPKIKRNKWSFEEDLTLGVALRIYGNKKWSKIANHLNGRTDIQCRERFCNILDPNLEEVEWKSAEDIKLLSLYEKYGNKWSKIAKEFGNRTDNTCWRRWKYLISVKNFGLVSSGNNNNLNCNSNSNLISNNGNNLRIGNVNFIVASKSELFDFTQGKNSLCNSNLSASNSNLVVNTPTTNNYSSLVNNKKNALKKDKIQKKLRISVSDDNKNMRNKKEEKLQDFIENENIKIEAKINKNKNNDNFETAKLLEDNNLMNKNKLFATSVAKQNFKGRGAGNNINNNNDYYFNSPKEIFLSNKANANKDKNENSINKANIIKTNVLVENTILERKYLRKRPRSPSNINNLNKSIRPKKLLKKEENEEADNYGSDDNVKSLLDSEETLSFSKKKMIIKDSNQEKEQLRNSSTNKKVFNL